MSTVCVLIDYQNIHLTGHGQFVPKGTPKHESLLLPQSFARQILDVRRNFVPPELADPELLSVRTFRGQPGNRKEPKSYSRSQAQTSNWTRDSRVSVHSRPLRYPWDWPNTPAQEKGIDVMLAIDLVQLASTRAYDILILASHDTDLEPAIAAAETLGMARVETAGWKGCKRLRGGQSGRWHTFLDGAAFVRSRDRTPYA